MAPLDRVVLLSDPGAVKVLASPDAVDYVKERGGVLFVWVDCLRCQGTVNFLEVSTESPGSQWSFRRLAGSDFDLYIDTGRLDMPNELSLDLKGRRRKHLRASWNGATFATNARPLTTP